MVEKAWLYVETQMASVQTAVSEYLWKLVHLISNEVEARTQGGCNFFFISDFIYLDPFPLLLYESMILAKSL